MSRSLLLFLSADHLLAQIMVGGRVSAQREFQDTQDSRRDFALFLETVKLPAYLLVDLVEEDFRHETIPHLFGRSRTALLQRKFEQFYRSTPFREATLLQRQETGRRDDDMLFSALTNPALITPWLEIMREHQTPLAGIYSVPQISAPLIKDHPAQHLLLISWEKYAGLRQTFFTDHRLQISRLTPIHGDLSFHDTVVTELTRTYQYLKSLSLLPPEHILDVLILCHASEHAILQDGRLPDSADMRYNFIDLVNIASQRNINHQFTDSDARQLFLRQLEAHPPRVNYASSEHLHYHSILQLRHRLNWLSGGLLLGSLLQATTHIVPGNQDYEAAATFRMQAQTTLREAQQISLALPDTLAPASDMKASVIATRKLADAALMPSEILLPLSAVLDNYPQAELDELALQVSATEPVAPNTRTDVPAKVITVEGHLTGFASNYRAALNYLDDLQHALTAQGYQVTVLGKPLDISPGGSIADQREARENSLGFSLKLSRRPPS